ncbi:hypothetical protein [Abyssisolibacter fermentans]|uniref:hypothetical protein n=1 Tax=Abyssisolibacter fermentans TaxID=1766203 RepID=UPI00082DB6C1|nr:hypothetical protein [Abyssisolibacter fermentans]
MSQETEKLKLFKYDSTDEDAVFNIDKALNENWDKIEQGIEELEIKTDELKITTKNNIDKIEYKIYNLYLQNYYENKMLNKRGMFFDGFINSNIIDLSNSSATLFTEGKKIGVVHKQEIKFDTDILSYKIFETEESYGTKRIGQIFTVDKNIRIRKVRVSLKRRSTTQDKIKCYITNLHEDGYTVKNTLQTSTTEISADTLKTDSPTTCEFNFDIVLQPGKYAFVLDRIGVYEENSWFSLCVNGNEEKGEPITAFREGYWRKESETAVHEIINENSPQNPVYQSKQIGLSQDINNAVLYVKSKIVSECTISADVAIYNDIETFIPMTLESTRSLEKGYREDKFVATVSDSGNKVKVKITMNRPNVTTDYEINEYGCILGVV